VFRNHFHYQTEKHIKIILFKQFSHIKDVKVLKDKYQESLTAATLNHQVKLILPIWPTSHYMLFSHEKDVRKLREIKDKSDLEFSN